VEGHAEQAGLAARGNLATNVEHRAHVARGGGVVVLEGAHDAGLFHHIPAGGSAGCLQQLHRRTEIQVRKHALDVNHWRGTTAAAAAAAGAAAARATAATATAGHQQQREPRRG
jgi:hypothetical protein